MRVQILESKRNNSVYVQLPECIGFFNKRVAEDLIVGNAYDVIIVGFSKKLNPRTSLPANVFLDLVSEKDCLLTMNILSTSGSMCSTSTYHPDVGMVYPEFHTPVPIVDNVSNDFKSIPCFPTPSIPIWIRKTLRGYRAIGVDSYQHIDPVFKKNNEEIQRVQTVLDEHYEIYLKYCGGNIIDGLSMSRAYEVMRAKHNIVREFTSWRFAE